MTFRASQELDKILSEQDRAKFAAQKAAIETPEFRREEAEFQAKLAKDRAGIKAKFLAARKSTQENPQAITRRQTRARLAAFAVAIRADWERMKPETELTGILELCRLPHVQQAFTEKGLSVPESQAELLAIIEKSGVPLDRILSDEADAIRPHDALELVLARFVKAFKAEPTKDHAALKNTTGTSAPRLPANPHVLELTRLLRGKSCEGRTKIDVATEYCNDHPSKTGKNSNPESLLRMVRRSKLLRRK